MRRTLLPDITRERVAEMALGAEAEVVTMVEGMDPVQGPLLLVDLARARSRYGLDDDRVLSHPTLTLSTDIDHGF